MPEEKTVEPETPQEEAAAIEEEYYVEEPTYEHLDPEPEEEAEDAPVEEAEPE